MKVSPPQEALQGKKEKKIFTEDFSKEQANEATPLPLAVTSEKAEIGENKEEDGWGKIGKRRKTQLVSDEPFSTPT